jgi:DNA (cytosine-5)-methyltransferase 1
VKPRLLDLFCGAGGAAMGYHRAGFEVVGVDIKPQPHYPFEFIQTDALAYLELFGAEYDFIHASPPCQEVSSTRHLRDAQGKKGRTLNLIPETRLWLIISGAAYVMENVPRAPLKDPIWLCGSMFGLAVERGPLRRHRGFESNVRLTALPDTHRLQGRPLGVYGSMRDDIPHGGRTVESLAEGQALMGIDWMKWDELKEAIPPAYTEWIGRQLMATLEQAA